MSTKTIKLPFLMKLTALDTSVINREFSEMKQVGNAWINAESIIAAIPKVRIWFKKEQSGTSRCEQEYTEVVLADGGTTTIVAESPDHIFIIVERAWKLQACKQIEAATFEEFKERFAVSPTESQATRKRSLPGA